jgi:hypothetical protein
LIIKEGILMQRTVTYFEKPGPDNTSSCLDIVTAEVKKHRYRHVVVASTKGDTGLLFAEALRKNLVRPDREQASSEYPKGVNLVIVTHSHGFKEPNTIEMSMEVRRSLEDHGATVYTGTMITHSLETALAKKFSGVYPTLLVAQSLRRFGEGIKVCCEIAMMAADAGLLPEGEETIAVAGTGRGADTVTVIRAATSKRFLDLKVLEILAKPRL